MIYRGTRSAGYGFVALATEAAAQKAIEQLNKQELEGRPVIVEIAKPADQKEKDVGQRKAKRRVGRRGSKAVPGEVTEAEANGEVEKPSASGDAAGKEGKPKKKKKFSVSNTFTLLRLCRVIVIETDTEKKKLNPLAQTQGQVC